MPTLTLGAASRLTGCAKSTVLRAIRAGRINANRDDTGQWQIEPVELFRVFPPLPIPPDATLTPAPLEHGAIADEITDDLVKRLREQLEDMRTQVADLRTDRDYWRQASDHWRVAFETTQRLLPAPGERGTTAVASWRGVFGQLCSTWAAQFATAVASWRGVFGQLYSTWAAQLATAVTSWRGVCGQLCSTWAAQLATAVASWRGVSGQLWSTWAAQLARQREHRLGERRGRLARHNPAHGFQPRERHLYGLGKGEGADDSEMPSYLFGRGHRGHTQRSAEAADFGAVLPEHGGGGGERDGEFEQDAERMIGGGIAYRAAPPGWLSIADKAGRPALDEVREVGQLHAGGDEAEIHPQFRQGTDPVTEHDKKLFHELTALLSSNGAIGFSNRHNIAGWLFRDAELDPLIEFHECGNAPDRSFITPELETARQALWSKVGDYLCVIAIETVPTNTPGWRSVPSEWEEEQPEHFERVVEKLHALTAEIVDLHADLVRAGRKHLIGAAKLPLVSPRTLSRHALPN